MRSMSLLKGILFGVLIVAGLAGITAASGRSRVPSFAAVAVAQAPGGVEIETAYSPIGRFRITVPGVVAPPGAPFLPILDEEALVVASDGVVARFILDPSDPAPATRIAVTLVPRGATVDDPSLIEVGGQSVDFEAGGATVSFNFEESSTAREFDLVWVGIRK